MDYESEKAYILMLWEKIPRRASQILKKEQPILYATINCKQGKTFSEKCWLYINQKDVPLTCEYCSNPTKYLDFGRGYAVYCSVKCLSNSASVQKKRQYTCISKYGETHFSKTQEYKEKFASTNLARYGVRNPGRRIDVMSSRARKKQKTYWNSLVSGLADTVTPLHSFDEYTHVRDSSLEWNCLTCGTVFSSSLFGHLPECTNCNPKPKPGSQSSVEKEILDNIRQFYNGEIIENSRDIISPKELDIYFPKEKFAIEVNGIYWHSSDRLDEDYHANKYRLCSKEGIKLLMITDLEWKEKKELLISMIKHRLGLNTQRHRVRPKHCQVKEIPYHTAYNFFESYHVSGMAKGKIYLGLYHENTLMSAIILSKSRFTKNDDVELIRYASPYNIAGALGKMLSYVRKNYNIKSIISYVDYRYGSGAVYQKNNFVHKGDSKPGYWYYYKQKVYHRLSWTKQKLVKLGYDASLTEKEIMKSLGAIRLYDCGHGIYKLDF